MSTCGSLKEFNPATDTVAHYLQRVKLYFTANAVEEKLQVAKLLSSISLSTYARLSDLVAPDELGSKTLDEIMTLLKGHFEPPRVNIADRFNLRKRNQASGETIADYVAELRTLASFCKFGDNLETELRDQIVCGLYNKSLQRRLLTEEDLTYKKTIEIAQETELAEKNAKTFRTTIFLFILFLILIIIFYFSGWKNGKL